MHFHVAHPGPDHTMAVTSLSRYIRAMAATPIEDAVIARFRELTPERQQEVLDFVNFLGTKTKRPRKSMRGLWKNLGISFSEEDIAKARKEMWGSFPREQFFD